MATLPNKKSSTIRTAIPQYIKRVERQHGQKVMYFHTDRGREYLGDVDQFFKTLGIQLEPTAPYCKRKRVLLAENKISSIGTGTPVSQSDSECEKIVT